MSPKVILPQKELFDEKKLKEIIDREKRRIDDEIEKLTEIESKLKEQKPFVWDIDFGEIFGEKGGFDIVIGNPPYVRQEKIAPPNKLKNEITNEEKRGYKEKLQKSVQVYFPFIKSIDKKSDYYIYFYFDGLSLLNPKGTFCFITSNSWLDVGYGKDLQEFLLKFVPIIAIYDNQAKRSFEHADVNTIIALFEAPSKSKETFPAIKSTAKFVMFKKPFEEVINTENLLKIEKADSVVSTEDFRIYPKIHEDLLEEGWEYPEEESSEVGVQSSELKEKGVIARSGAMKQSHESLLKDKFFTGKYTGNKWGGKYLRAPDIYFTILEKGKDKLVKLGDIAEVITVSWSRQGQNSILMSRKPIKNQKVRIVDVLKSPKDVEKINLKTFDTLCGLRLEKWVEKQIVYAPILWVDLRGDKHICHHCLEPIAFTHNFHGITPYDKDFSEVLCAFLNSTLSWFFIEVLGRRGLGGGAVRILVKDLKFQFPILIFSKLTPSN